jgi:hypothetical protein
MLEPTAREKTLLYGEVRDMSITLSGVLHGRRIDLEAEAPIPDGTAVLVSVKRKPLTTEEKQRLLAATAGAWADDPSLEPLFVEIARRRHESVPRDIGLE